MRNKTTVGWWETKNRTKTTLPSIPFFDSFTSYPWHKAIQDAESLTFSLCHSFLLTFFPCSSMESLSQDAVLLKLIPHGLPVDCSSSRAVPIWVCTHTIPSGMDCSSVDLPWAAILARQPWSTMGFTPKVTVPAWSLLVHGLCMSYSFLQPMSTCCGMGSSMNCNMYVCSNMVLHGLQRANALHNGLLLNPFTTTL